MVNFHKCKCWLAAKGSKCVVYSCLQTLGIDLHVYYHFKVVYIRWLNDNGTLHYEDETLKKYATRRPTEQKFVKKPWSTNLTDDNKNLLKWPLLK